MQKNKVYLLIALAVIILGGAAWYFTSSSFSYKVVDEISDTSEGGNTTFLFVDVNELDSLEIYKASQELLKKRIIDKYAGKEMPQDAMHQEGGSELLIAYFYKQDDTTAIPDAMKQVLRSKFPMNDMVKHNLNYISEGFMYTGVYNPFQKQKTIDSLSPRTMLFVPKPGTLAKDIMQGMPADHPPMDMNQLPEGHPSVDQNELPAGHPPMDMNSMPAGHPPVNSEKKPDGKK